MKIPQTKRYSVYKKLVLIEEQRRMNEGEGRILFFEPDGREHYVYRVTDHTRSEKEHYYGSHTPKKGKKYNSLEDEFWTYKTSSKYNILNEDRKENYKVKILRVFDNPADKMIYEAFLHQYFDVKLHNKFWNESNQTPFGFDTTGNKELAEKISMRRTGQSYDCLKKENNGMYNKITITDGNTNKSWYKDEPIPEGFKNIVTGTVTIKENGEYKRITKEEFDKGDKRGCTYNQVPVITDEGTKMVSKEEFYNGNYVHPNKGKNKGKKAYQALKIFIYDKNNNVVYKCHGDFKEVCEQNNLPFASLARTYRQEKKIILEHQTKSFLENHKQFEGWYARKIKT